MTDLTQAIKTVQLLVPPDETPWQASWIPDEAQTSIFYAVASGDLIPLTDAKLAVAEAYRKAASVAANACLVEPDGGSPTEDERLVCEEAYRRILALAPDDALAEVQALRADLAGWMSNTEDACKHGMKHQARAEAAEAELAATQAKLARK